MNPEIFVSSFNELVHHMTADHALALVALLSLTWVFLWSCDGARPFFSAARYYQKVKREHVAEDVYRHGWRIFRRGMWQFPRAFLISGLVVIVLDYLVLVFLNLMGW